MYVIPVWPRYIRITLQITWLVSSVRKNTSAFLRDVKEIPREQKVAGTQDQTHLLDNPCPCYSLEVFSEAMIFHSCLGLWTVAFGERLPEELLLICLWSFSRGGLFCKIKRQLQKPSQRLQLLLPLLLWDTVATPEHIPLPPLHSSIYSTPIFSAEHLACPATVAKNHPTLFSWNSLYAVTAALYCWCWTANPWSECAFLAGFTNARKELHAAGENWATT